jgi:CheY-like chemotaxis protein
MPTVLIVEDDPDVREALVTLLTGEGYATIEAADGRHALTILRRDPRPLIVLLDLAIPWLNGLDILRIIDRQSYLRLGRHRAFIVQSARALMNPALVQDILDKYQIPVITKPYDIDEVLTAVAKATQQLESAE